MSALGLIAIYVIGLLTFCVLFVRKLWKMLDKAFPTKKKVE